MRRIVLLLALVSASPGWAAAGVKWPDVARPAASSGGEHDAAVLIGSHAELDSHHVQRLVCALKATGRARRDRGCPDHQTTLFPAISDPEHGDQP